MPVMESLRRLDDRFVPRSDKAAARARRYLPLLLLVAYVAHLAALRTEARFLDGLVSGLLLTSFAAAVTTFMAGTRGEGG